MLTENDVIKYTVEYLKNNGYSIEEIHDTNQRGHDIKSSKEGKYLYIEVKGQTSSKKGTNRYGKEFNSGQKRDHVSVALFKSMETMNAHPDAKIAISFPDDNGRYKKLITGVLPTLKRIGIGVFFVNPNGLVSEI